MATWPTHVRWLCVLWFLSLLPSWGCRRPPTIHARNVVIITLDTTRADHVAAYGPSRASTPTLDRLAREGVVFEQATSVAPLTLPAHCSLFTGLLPPHHGVRDNAADALATDRTTLAAVLQRGGFQTAAFVGSAVLQANRGLSRGFDVYHDGLSKDPWVPSRYRRPANEVVDDALEWLASQTDAPVFMWIHLYDAHAPYLLPEPYDAVYSDDPYAGEIAFADAQIGRFVAALDLRHDLDRTAFVVVGDHGESLGEHGERGHGLFVYEEVLRVPLIVRAPGLTPARVTAVTTLVDVMPTVLDLVGAPSSPLDGDSLLGFLTGTTRFSEREVYSESMYPLRFGSSPLRTVRRGPFKFIEAPRLPKDRIAAYNELVRRQGAHGTDRKDD